MLTRPTLSYATASVSKTSTLPFKKTRKNPFVVQNANDTVMSREAALMLQTRVVHAGTSTAQLKGF